VDRVREIPWLRISAEGAAIVVSILLAFAIEAWWAERLERSDEELQLERLRVEFSTNIERIDARVFEEGILDATANVYGLIEEGRNQGVDVIEVPAVLIGMMLFAPTFDADTPILSGLVRSGGLQVIENERVLSLISVWERTFYDYTTFAERARRSVDERLIPALTVRGDIGPILMTPSIDFNQIRADGLADVRLQIDDELKGLVAERWRNGRSAFRRFMSARDVANELVAEIDSGIL
jgi:hypothetical protein